jgi:hypothetical protein
MHLTDEEVNAEDWVFCRACSVRTHRNLLRLHVQTALCNRYLGMPVSDLVQRHSATVQSVQTVKGTTVRHFLVGTGLHRP